MEIKINTKYEIGDKFYSIEENFKYPPCEKCKGTVELELVLGGFITCDTCRGRKINDGIEISYYVPTDLLEIDAISVEVNEQSEMIIIYFGKNQEGVRYQQGFIEEECFSTIEEAKNQCDVQSYSQRN